MVKTGWLCFQSVVVVVVVVVVVLVWTAGALGKELELLESEAGPLSATKAVDNVRIPTAKIKRFIDVYPSQLKSLSRSTVFVPRTCTVHYPLSKHKPWRPPVTNIRLEPRRNITQPKNAFNPLS